MPSICVFLGSSFGVNESYTNATIALAKALVTRQIHVVFGGSDHGLMGVLADTVLAEGGSITGVITHELYDMAGNDRLTKLHKIETMFERKLMMTQLADGFIALPGGLGTFDEIFEVWSAAKLAIHNKPIGLLNINNFYHKLIEWVDYSVAQGFDTVTHRELITIADEPNELLDRMGFHLLETPQIVLEPAIV